MLPVKPGRARLMGCVVDQDIEPPAFHSPGNDDERHQQCGRVRSPCGCSSWRARSTVLKKARGITCRRDGGDDPRRHEGACRSSDAHRARNAARYSAVTGLPLKKSDLKIQQTRALGTGKSAANSCGSPSRKALTISSWPKRIPIRPLNLLHSAPSSGSSPACRAAHLERSLKHRSTAHNAVHP